MKDYMTIAEFADAAGVSRQAIYKRLSTDLQPFVKVDNGKKYLNSKALQLFNSTAVESSDNSVTDQLISILRDELKEKDHQIELLSEQITKAHTLVDQEQKLHAHSKALLTGNSKDNADAAYSRGYEDAKRIYRDRYQNELQAIARILINKYPAAVDYIISEAEKKHH